VTDGADVEMRLGSFKFLFSHLTFPPKLGIKSGYFKSWS